MTDTRLMLRNVQRQFSPQLAIVRRWVAESEGGIPAPAIAAIFAVFALLSLLLTATIMPPFQNADEPAHAYRADQLSHGQILAKNLTPFTAGGKIDAGLRDAAAAFAGIPFHGQNKVTRSMYARRPWGQHIKQEFSGSAVYPPFFYLPAIAALTIARGLNTDVLTAVTAARLATGVTSIAIATIALFLADQAAIWLFAVLMLPMSFCLMGALSQSAPMIAATALAASLLRRAASGDASPRLLAAIAALLAIVAMARPPYAAFALLLLTVPARMRDRLLAFASVILATLGWALLNLHRAHYTMAPPGAIDPILQLHGLLAAPGQIPALLLKTWQHLGASTLDEFIGVPGWLDVYLPAAHQNAAWVVLGLAFVVLVRTSRLRGGASLMVPLTMMAACLAIALVAYMAASLVGHTEISGMQGRYFLAPALLAAALPPRERVAGSWIVLPQLAVLAFPVISIPVTINALIDRYYF